MTELQPKGISFEEPAEPLVPSFRPRSSWWDSIPNAISDVALEPRPIRPSKPRKVKRRRFLQTTVAVGGALSVGFLDAVTGLRLRAAGAAPPLRGHLNCVVFTDQSPGYDDNTLVCYGAPYSYRYCTERAWFKSTSTSTVRYTPVTSACDGVNAWRWYHSNTATQSSVGTYRCSDGRISYKVNGTWTTPEFVICSGKVSSGDTTRG